MSCLFCKIIKQEIPANIVYEADDILAFEDVNPQAPVHILVIPRKHIATTLDITDDDNELIGKMHQVAAKIAQDRSVADKGFRLVMNCNRDAGQTVFHIHLHLIGGRPMNWPPG
jgi:histidine triad (HIT) family protein